MECWEIVLEYLKVVLSWPSIVAFLGLFFITLFRSEIKELLNSMVEVRGPGNFSALFEGLEENVDIEDLHEKYPKWRELISHVIEDYRTFIKHGTLSPSSEPPEAPHSNNKSQEK